MVKKQKKPEQETVSGSVEPSPYVTTGRRREEKRLASGNTRRGATAAKKAAAASHGKRPRGKKKLPGAL